MKPTFIPSLQLNRTCQPSSLNGHLPSFSTIFPLSEDSQFWSFLMVWVLFWLHLSLPANPLDNSSINNGIKNHFSFQNALTGGHYNERWQIEKNGVKWNWKSKIVNRMNECNGQQRRRWTLSIYYKSFYVICMKILVIKITFRNNFIWRNEGMGTM